MRKYSSMPWCLLAAVYLATLVVLPARGKSLPSPGQTILAVTTYGDFITNDDVEQRTKLDFLITQKQASQEEVIRQLSMDMAKSHEAEGAGLQAETEVDKAFADLCTRLNVTPEQLTESLKDKGIGFDILRERLKAEVARESLARKKSHGFEDRLDRPLIPQK
ncbi:hypothetical protein JQ604_30710 [Bradyrhizobium jicamae]|nr:hypothetical protein [Bradyrhizobium jicamae]